MNVTFYYVPRIERILITNEFDIEAVGKFCPMDGAIIRETRCTRSELKEVHNIWKEIQIQNDWYIASKRLINWVKTFKKISNLPNPRTDSKNKIHNLLNEEVVLFTQGKTHPRIRHTYDQLRRYAKKGLNKNGKRVFLETVDMPEGKATTVEAFQRFIRQLQP